MKSPSVHLAIPKVSAIIPAYNSSPFIQDTIESLLAQSISLSEIIVVDDLSSDDTYEVVLKIAQSSHGIVKIRRLTENCGPSQSRNIGLGMAREKLVLLMDHDDIADNMLVEEEYDKFMELEDDSPGSYVLVHSAYSQIDQDGFGISGVHRWRQVGKDEVLGYMLVRNRILSCSGVLMKKELALRVGGFDCGLRYSQDWDLWLRLAETGGFGYVDSPLVKIRRHSNNLSRIISDAEKDELTILSRYAIPFIEKAIYRRKSTRLMNRIDFVSVLYRLGRWDEGFRIIKDVINKRPDLSSPFFWAGLYYVKNGDLYAAKEAFEQAIEIDPENGAALNNYGVIVALCGEHGKAAGLLKNAIAMLPNYLDAKHNLSCLERKPGHDASCFKFTLRELRPVLLTYADTE